VRAEARARGRRGAGPGTYESEKAPAHPGAVPLLASNRHCRVQARRARARPPQLTPGALPQAVPAISFPRSQRDKQSKVFISKLHSKGTGESVSGALCGVRTRGSDATLAPRALIWLSEQGDRRSLIAAATFLLGCSKMSALSVGEGRAARIRASRECDAARVLAPARLRPSHTRSAHAPCCPPLDLCRGVAVLTQNRCSLTRVIDSEQSERTVMTKVKKSVTKGAAMPLSTRHSPAPASCAATSAFCWVQ